MITIPAAIKGTFKTYFQKEYGFVLDNGSYPATVTTFTLNYLIVWICVGICYSGVIRNMPEECQKDIIGTAETSA